MIDEAKAEKQLKRQIAKLGKKQLLSRLRAACVAQGVDYDVAPGKREPIELLPSPVLLSRPQMAFLHKLSEVINSYVRRMPVLFREDAAVRAALPFPPVETQWIESCTTSAPQVIVTRNDLDMPGDPRGTVAFETNGCSIGGIYYAGASARVVMSEVLSHPELPANRLQPLTDACEVVLELLQVHARTLGKSGPLRLGILENRDWTLGITEMGSLQRFMEAHGVSCVIGDPRELVARPLQLGGKPVDLIYRNMELSDFVALESEGHDMSAMRQVFRDNVVLSGLAGDFDHKSVWEVLTSAATKHVIEPRHRAFLKKHLLWTRLLRDTETEGPDKKKVDLVPYARQNQHKLVLKPNRACGGEGVTLGPLLSARVWERALERALGEPGAWVLQRFHHGTQKRFPTSPSDKAPYFVTYGVVSSPHGFGVLGRACKKAIVNVSAGGGLVAVLREP